ncbi:MAG: methionyl-tRNA formyltransferase [Chloroflexi bacterium]|nr:methionyl-tRNA formyltransferase [Chloroflexota bacterium]
MTVRVVFMGTPDFAVPTLERLLHAEDVQVVGVVTRPDKPKGRSKKPVPSPVKEVAVQHGIPVYQPRTLRTPEAQEPLRAWRPDVIVVAAFGLILPKAVLDIPPYGNLNVHASLLPRWRGAAPIPAAILAGDEETGVTIMLMDEGVDTGPILAQRAEPILPDDTSETLSRRLAYLGADLLMDTLPRWLRGEIQPQPQDERQATYAPMLKKKDGWIDWHRPASYIERQVRAYVPWPTAMTRWKGRVLKILRARAHPHIQPEGIPGTVIPWDKGAAVITGEGVLELQEVQLAGKRALPIHAFLRGARGFIGSLLEGHERTTSDA